MHSENTLVNAQSSSSSGSSRFGLSQVWVRFLMAIFGLMLAFGAALFSTVSREAGSVWGTVFLASVALLLATFVGLTTVPYLARRVVASRVREAMDYDVTRAGIAAFHQQIRKQLILHRKNSTVAAWEISRNRLGLR